MYHISNEWLLLILLLLIVLSAFFSGSEISMMSLNRYRLRHLVRMQKKSALRVYKLLERPDRLLGVILIGNNFANIFASAIATVLAVRWLGDPGIAVATVILTLFILIFSEMLPKTIAALHAQTIALWVARPLSWLAKVLAPLVWLTNFVVNGILTLFKVKLENQQATDALSREELRTVVHETGSLIPTQHRNMLLGILDLEKVTVEDVMVPKNEIVGIDVTEPWEEILEQLEMTQYTRLPIYEGSIDQVRGVVDIRAVFKTLVDGELDKKHLLAIAQECYFVPETTPLNLQLMQFKQENQRMCLVVDEYGDIQGLVALEDILEEIVGELTTGITSKGRDVYQQADGSVIVEGTTLIRDLNRAMGWNLPTDGPKTLSGLVIEYLEFIPTARVSTLIAGYPIEIMQVRENMIKTAKVSPPLSNVSSK